MHGNRVSFGGCILLLDPLADIIKSGFMCTHHFRGYSVLILPHKIALAGGYMQGRFPVERALSGAMFMEGRVFPFETHSHLGC